MGGVFLKIHKNISKKFVFQIVQFQEYKFLTVNDLEVWN